MHHLNHDLGDFSKGIKSMIKIKFAVHEMMHLHKFILVYAQAIKKKINWSLIIIGKMVVIDLDYDVNVSKTHITLSIKWP